MTLYDPSDVDVFCPSCKKPMGFESNCFVGNFMCDNPNCKAYLRRHGGIGKSFGGKVALDGFSFKFYPEKKKKRVKEEVGNLIGLILSFAGIIICMVIVGNSILLLKQVTP